MCFDVIVSSVFCYLGPRLLRSSWGPGATWVIFMYAVNPSAAGKVGLFSGVGKMAPNKPCARCQQHIVIGVEWCQHWVTSAYRHNAYKHAKPGAKYLSAYKGVIALRLEL